MSIRFFPREVRNEKGEWSGRHLTFHVSISLFSHRRLAWHSRYSRLKPRTVIKVVGVGGAGGNAVQHMIARGVQGWSSSAPTPTTRRWHALRRATSCSWGNRAGRRQQARGGKQAAIEARERIADALRARTWCSSRRHGRRHRHRRRAGGGRNRQGTRHPDRCRGVEAVRLRRARRSKVAETGLANSRSASTR